MNETLIGPGGNLTARERVAVALDVPTAEDALRARDSFGDALGLAKVGSALFVRAGLPLIAELKDGGAQVFLDLKFHDIPTVVGQAVDKAVDAGVDYLTVHAAGGPAMVEAAVRAAERGSTRVLAVTVLTSLDLESWRAGASPDEASVEAAVSRLASLAVGAGAHGLVGSAREAGILRRAGGPSCTVVTPGIHMPGSETPDQSRSVSVEEAVRSGSDILVIGRGVMNAPDPAAALRSVQHALEEVSR
ncbi:MAG: orotidine 5'-phosphate decarboxylase [Gemmatimonadota bacterium]|nr:MAG: orotidine 5'-phosphate decarboxylase [Gemmatimonadota bacterium]